MYNINVSLEGFRPLLSRFGVFIIILLVILGAIAVSVLVFEKICVWKVFKKAGKSGWEAIVPFYSDWVLCEIAGVKWWFWLIMDIAEVGAVFTFYYFGSIPGIFAALASFVAHYNLAKKFGKDPIPYGIGLTLVPVVFYAILAFGNNVFNDTVSVSPYGPINDVNDEQDKNIWDSVCKHCGCKLAKGDYCPGCGKKVR